PGRRSNRNVLRKFLADVPAPDRNRQSSISPRGMIRGETAAPGCKNIEGGRISLGDRREIQPGSRVAVQFVEETVAPREESPVAVQRKDAQSAEISDRLGTAVDEAFADGAHAESDDVSLQPVAPQNHLVEPSLDGRGVKKARLAS